MAKCIMPAGSVETRGRIGGLVHNTWRGISYVKAQSSPAQPRSKLQLQIRAWTTYLVRKWATITAANRATWTAYAASHTLNDWTGNPKRLTGLNWYVKCNCNLLRAGYAIVDTAPITAAPDAPLAFAAADGILQTIVTWTATAGTDKILEFFLVGPHSVGLQAKIERATFRSAETGEAGTATLSALTVGRYTIFARVLDEDNGLVSPWVSDTADISAA